MSNSASDKKFKKWLDILQQESWQLELIISGFAIYGLFLIIDPIRIEIIEAQINKNSYAEVFWDVLLMSWFILATNLLAHVVLRGLWIGAIGLRYVSGDIDYQKLNYSGKFMRHLERRVGSFDNYVAQLEKYCSVIFAITFLLIFYLLGIVIIVFIIVGLSEWMGSSGYNTSRNWIAIPLILFIVIGSFLTFIDFITQGWLKKRKWTTRIYYPFYWVFKFLTLSFLYRPMVYNFLDTKFGKRLSFFIVPLYIGIAILAGTGFSTSNYLDDDLNSSARIADVNAYSENLIEPTDYIKLASIPSKVISKEYLPVFIVYGSSVEDDVFYFNKELKPEEDNRGLYSPFSSATVGWRKKRDLLEDYLDTLEEMYRLKIDSTLHDTEFVVTKNKRDQRGYETVLDLQNLSRGKHLLEVSRKDHLRDSVYFRTIIKIPFWFYPEK